MKLSIKSRSQHGFTLIELMVTVVLIGLVAGMAAPSMERSIQQFKFKSQAKDLISTLRMARSHAISEKIPYGVYFDFENCEIISFRDDVNQSNHTYDVGSDSLISVDSLDGRYKYLWASFTTQSIIFQPNGTAHESGDIYMYSERDGSMNWCNTNVLASTGRAKMGYLNSY